MRLTEFSRRTRGGTKRPRVIRAFDTYGWENVADPVYDCQETSSTLARTVRRRPASSS